MYFSPFMWAVEAISVVLELVIFLSAKCPSLRWLMLFLIAGNVTAVATRNNYLLYWDTIWTGRAIAMCWFLWVVGTMFSDKPNWIMRFPVVMNAALFFFYWPMSPDTTLEQLEVYRSFGFGLALAIAVIGLITLLPKGAIGPLHLGLIGFLAAEFSAALIGRAYTWAPEIQLSCWVGAIGSLAAVSVLSSSGATRNRPPALQPEQSGH